MSIERSHGRARVVLPRSSDLPATVTPTDRTAGRDAAGRFAPRHGFRYTRAWERRIESMLGAGLEGEAGALGREAHRWYRALCAEMPALSDGVRALVAQRARALALSGFYARRGAELGPTTEDGMAALGEATKWDARAERLAVTAWDLSTRAAAAAAKRRPADVHAEVLRAFGDQPEGDR